MDSCILSRQVNPDSAIASYERLATAFSGMSVNKIPLDIAKQKTPQGVFFVSNQSERGWLRFVKEPPSH